LAIIQFGPPMLNQYFLLNRFCTKRKKRASENQVSLCLAKQDITSEVDRFTG